MKSDLPTYLPLNMTSYVDAPLFKWQQIQTYHSREKISANIKRDILNIDHFEIKLPLSKAGAAATAVTFASLRLRSK